jgi:RNA polymerase sigma factor (sigma-70 family)
MNKSERLEIFERVRSQYGSFLTAVLWKLTGERELFAEAFQIALIKIWQNIEKLDSSAAGAYIYRIALSANSTAWKKRISSNGQTSIDQCQQEPAAKEEYIDVELVEKVRKAIAKLPGKQSTAIVMRYLEQQDYEKIAAKLGCSEVSARSNVSKGLAALRMKLAGLIDGGF